MSNEFIKENRIAEALSIRGWKQIELSEKTGIPKNSVNAWVKQKWQPKQKAIMKMAQALDVSEMWLAGYNAPMERNIADKNSSEVAALFDRILRDKQLYKLAINLTKLNDSQLTIVIKMVRTGTPP